MFEVNYNNDSFEIVLSYEYENNINVEIVGVSSFELEITDIENLYRHIVEEIDYYLGD